MTLRIVCVAAAGLITCSYARAAEKTMPINFIGEWCNPTTFEGKTNYRRRRRYPTVGSFCFYRSSLITTAPPGARNARDKIHASIVRQATALAFLVWGPIFSERSF